MLYVARLSFESVAPTVMADDTKAGENEHASLLSLPAATTTTTPLVTALSMTPEKSGTAPGPPKLMLSTDGLLPFDATWSTPENCQDKAPLPESDKVLMEYTFAPGATP